MFGRRLQTRLDLLSPCILNPNDQTSRILHSSRTFTTGREVWYRDASSSGKKGETRYIKSQMGNAMYEIIPDQYPEQVVRRRGPVDAARHLSQAQTNTMRGRTLVIRVHFRTNWSSHRSPKETKF